MKPTSPALKGNLRLREKVLVVVGGTSGMGLSAARAFLREGAKLVVVGRNVEKARAVGEELGARVRVVSGDASAPETAVRAIQMARTELGGFHGLYHVAGGSGRRHGDGPLHAITDEGWAYTLGENLNSLFYSNRAAVQAWMKEGTGGAVLNMGSILGSWPSPKHFGTQAYATAKAAVVGLTRSAAAQYASSNIRFNVIAPALVATPMSERAQGNAEILKFIASKQPLDGGRIGQASDLDAAAVYLLSDESKFVTGQILAVDGGWSVSEGQFS